MMDSSISEVQFADPGENSYTTKYSSCVESDDDMQTVKTQCNTKDISSFKNEEEGMDSSDAAYGSYESTSGCLPLPPSVSVASSLFDSIKQSNTFQSDNDAQNHGTMDSSVSEPNKEDEMHMHENSEQLVADSEEMVSVEFSEAPNELPQTGVVSEDVDVPISDETSVKYNKDMKFEFGENDGETENGVDFSYTTIDDSLENNTVSKLEILSEDEEVGFPKSGAESSSSKDESRSGPSCSGTSYRDINSLSSDSDVELPDINMTLPLKKRKRESKVETICYSSSSCSEDEGEIDYENLTPDQIKALIEQAKSIKHKCLCPKRKWSELPVKGPTEPSGKCNVGKGTLTSEEKPCASCSGGVCNKAHKQGRHSRRKYTHIRNALARSRARGTIGQDVPIIELSDGEGSPVPNRVASTVTVTSVGECITVSSSDDDSDIVCEGIIKTDRKPQEPNTLSSGNYLSTGSPDVVVLNLPSVDGSSAPAEAQVPSAAAVPPALPAFPVPGTDLDLLDFDIDNDMWNDMNMLCDIIRPSNAAGTSVNTPQAGASAAVPERPSTPEGWSCPICLESKTAVPEIMSTTCGHIFCGTCIRSAVRIHKKCPTCRKKLTVKQFHKIFL